MMRLSFGVLCLLLIDLVSNVSYAQGQDEHEEDRAVLRHLKTVEWPRAYRDQDVAFLDRLLADEFERIGFDGTRSSKQDELARVRASRPEYDTLDFDITRLDVFGNGTAVVSGVGTVSGRDADGRYTMTYTSSNVLLKVDGRWRAISSHVSGRNIQRHR